MYWNKNLKKISKLQPQSTQNTETLQVKKKKDNR